MDPLPLHHNSDIVKELSGHDLLEYQHGPWLEVETTRPEDGSELPQVIHCEKVSVVYYNEYIKWQVVAEGSHDTFMFPLENLHKIRLVKP